MAGVTIDIPGIGNIEAKNAATEATLKEILKAMQSMNKAVGGSNSPSSSGSSGGSSGGSGGGGGGLVGKAANQTAGAFSKLSNIAGQTAGSMLNLALNSGKVIESFADVGDSVSKAASVFSGIPVVGQVFKVVAAAATETVNSFQKASASGASFGGSLQSFSASASAAGMTMDKFAGLVAKNGESMRFLGGNTDDGAKRFAQIAGGLRKVSGDLYNLGYSTEDVNEGLANYTKLAMQGGKNTNMTNAQLVQGTKSYMKEMDLLAKVTGETRKQQEDAQAKLAQDAQYQAAMAGMSEEVASSFRNTVTGLPGPLRDVAKDIMATGTATTEESQKFMAMMPESAAMMRDFAAKTQRGEEISLAERNKLNETLRREGKAANDQYKDVGRYSKEFATQTNQFTAAAGIGKDALVSGAKAQDAATKRKENEAAQMEKAKQALAEFSNGFQMALVNSGILNTLMGAFKIVAGIVTDYLIPTFNILAGAITLVGGYLIDNLKPVFEAVGTFLKDTVYPAFLQVAAVVMTDVVPFLQEMGRMISEDVWPALQSMGAAISEYLQPVFESVGAFISDNLTPILFGLGASLAAYGVWLAASTVAGWVQTAATVAASLGVGGLAAAAWAAAAPILAIVAPVVAIVGLFIYLYKQGWSFGTAMEALKDNFSRFMLMLDDAINGLLTLIPNAMGGISKEEGEKRKALNDATRKELDEKEKARDAQREATVKERDSDKKKEERAEAAAKIDKKITGMKAGHAGDLKDANDKEKAAKAEGVKKDYTDPIALLKAEAEQQKSGFIKDKPSTTTAAADATKKSIEASAEEKKTAEAKAKEAEDAKKKEDAAKTGPTAPAQETPETLLASLNTKLDQLIKINKGAAEVGEKQLVVQRGLTGNLYAT